MSVLVTFQLGPATGRSARQLTITRVTKAGDDAAPAAEVDTDVGAVTTTSQQLPVKERWTAKLVDTLTSGAVGVADYLALLGSKWLAGGRGRRSGSRWQS